jgi:hypothetical protein
MAASAVKTTFPNTVNIGILQIAGTAITATGAQLNFVSGVTAGTGAASKALVLNSSSTITTGITALTATTLNAGASGTAGTLVSFPATAANGTLIFAATNNASNFAMTVTNAATVGQATVLTLPDPGAATAHVLLDTGAANTLTDFQQFVGITSGTFTTGGTWTVTRNAMGNMALVRTAAAATNVLCFEIPVPIRTTASKGVKLTSIDVLSTVGTANLTSATPTLSITNYIAGSAVTITGVTLGGSLTVATGTFAVDNLTVTTPVFLNTVDSKYNLEISYVCPSTTTLSVYGLMLHFSETIA